jgi:hypothetical protein
MLGSTKRAHKASLMSITVGVDRDPQVRRAPMKRAAGWR